MIRLREYQKGAYESLKDWYRNDRKSRFGQMWLFCGFGKTILFLKAIEEFRPKRVLVVVPTSELVRQTRDRIRQFLPERERETFLVCSRTNRIRGSVEYDEFLSLKEKEGLDSFILITTYQTLRSREGRLSDLSDFDFSVFDECHIFFGEKKLTQNLIFEAAEVSRKSLFLTATPLLYEESGVFSAEKVRLFGRVLHQLLAAEAIEAGLLRRPQILSKSIPELSSRGIAREVLSVNARKPIVFVDSIRLARKVHEELLRLKADSYLFVSDRRELKHRTEKMKKFLSQEKAVAVTVNVVSEGFDDPSIDACLYFSRKKSQRWLIQTSGRILRPDRKNPNKLPKIVFFFSQSDRKQKENAEEARSFLTDVYIRGEASPYVASISETKKIDHIWTDDLSLFSAYGLNAKRLTQLLRIRLKSLLVFDSKAYSLLPKEAVLRSIREISRRAISTSDERILLREATQRPEETKKKFVRAVIEWAQDIDEPIERKVLPVIESWFDNRAESFRERLMCLSASLESQKKYRLRIRARS